MFYKLPVSKLLVAISIACFLLAVPASLAQTAQLSQPAAWVLAAEIVGSSPENSLQVSSKRKVAVTFYKSGEEQKKSPFEILWYSSGKPVGIEKQAILNVPINQRVNIKIAASSVEAPLEVKTATDTILRLVLKVLLNHDTVGAVTVPTSSFGSIVQELGYRNARVASPGQQLPSEAKVSFAVESESGLQQTVYFM